MIRKNETKTDFDLLTFINNNKDFDKTWELQKTTNKNIQNILDNSSKKGTGNHGSPDLIYINENKKIIILVENKNLVKDHISKDKNNPVDFAVDGIKHYLSFFTQEGFKEWKVKETIEKYFKNWKIIGIAFSGDINDEYNHKMDTFVIQNDKIVDIKKKEILDEEDYIAYFENIDLEKITNDISKSSSEINILLRNIDSQKRPILLSALMICLYDKYTDFKDNYNSWTVKTIIRNIPTTIEDILEKENINESKIKILTNELTFLKNDIDLNESDILKSILNELQNNIIPLFPRKTNYDIIGKFYEEFLRFAGVANVKKGIVLTPSHITTLFTELVDIKYNDTIFDPACGTGAFLIAGMNKIINEIENSSIPDKSKKINGVKQEQLIGFEKSSTMYTLAISNMLFRGDGKSQIFNEDFFSEDADKILEKLNPTIGFVNPPYGGKDNNKNPTKKEIQFLEKMLDSVSRYGIIIAPISTYFKDEDIRNRILSKHTLKYVINMPGELFQPNASTHTGIAVFETHKPHNNSKVVLYDLKDDGLVLSKNKGRTDVLNKWKGIKSNLLNKINNPSENDDSINLIYKEIEENEEWIIQAHSKTDWNYLEKSFIYNIKSYAIFRVKLELDLIEKKISEVELLDIFSSDLFSKKSVIKKKYTLDFKNFKEFDLKKVFTVRGSKKSFTKNEVVSGEYLYVTTSNKNNGISGTSNIWTEDKNVITIDSATDAVAFYQSDKFIGSDHVEVLEPIDFKLSKYSGLFMVSILNIQMPRYSFGRKRSQTRIKKEKLFLPVNKKGEIDFEFMEKYIKSLPYSSNI